MQFSRGQGELPMEAHMLSVSSIKIAIALVTRSKRNYKSEYRDYHSAPLQKKRRAQRNSSRRKMEKNGHVKKGDKKDVHHKDHDTSNQEFSNLGVTSQKYNRSRNR